MIDMLSPFQQKKESNVADILERQQEVRNIYKCFTLQDGQTGEWISKEWIGAWLANDTSEPVPQIDNSSALCPHKK